MITRIVAQFAIGRDAPTNAPGKDHGNGPAPDARLITHRKRLELGSILRQSPKTQNAQCGRFVIHDGWYCHRPDGRFSRCDRDKLEVIAGVDGAEQSSCFGGT